MQGYKDIKSHIYELIRSRALQPGDRLQPARELAEELGVSYVTAHKAVKELAEDGLVRREGRRGTFVTRRIGTSRYTIAVILPSLDQLSTYPEFLHGIDRRIVQRGHRMQLHLSNHDPIRLRDIVESLCDDPVDGVIYTPTGAGDDFVRLNDEFLARFRERKIPFVVAGHCELPSVPDISGVSTNHFRGAYDLVSYLASLGHKRIAMIYNKLNHDRQAIMDGFCKAMEDAGLERHEELMRCLPDRVSPRAEVKQLLHSRVKPTAIFTINELFAQKTLAGLSEMGLAVPRDIALVAFGDSPMVPLLPIKLTTVHIRHGEEGDLLAGMLLDILDGRIEPPCRTELPAQLRIRESCGGQRGSWQSEANTTMHAQHAFNAAQQISKETQPTVG